jgi:hypothetical protein
MTAKMRHGAQNPRISWKTLVARSEDPFEFARELQSCFQELTDGGFNIVSQLMRGGAMVITGQRVEMLNPFPLSEPQPPGPMPMPPAAQQPQRARIVQPQPRPLQSASSTEVLYHWLEHGQGKQKSYPSMVDALRAVKGHIEVGDPPILPVSIVAVSMTKYDLVSIPALLKMYAEELKLPVDKPLG